VTAVERTRSRATVAPAATLPTYEFAVAAADAELASLRPEWLNLYARSETRSPFAHPDWTTVWLRAYVPDPADRFVVTVRHGGRLVAVAPFYVRRHGSWPLAARCLQLVGGSTGPEDPLTEMAEILVDPVSWRRTMRALFHHLAEHGPEFEWIGVTLSHRQGWFDDEWLPAEWRRRGGVALHKSTRPFVVMPLPPRFEELALKRNLKEAIRRSRNRMQALDPPFEVRFLDGPGLDTAVAQIQELHRQRAALRGHAVHSDYFTSEVTRRLAVDGVRALAAAGAGSVAVVERAGHMLAGRVLLHANSSLFLSFSGADTEYWALGAPTLLLVSAIRRAIERGDTLVNFSQTPDQAKLRWSDALAYEQEFVVVAPTRRARRAFGAYWQVRASRGVARRRVVTAQAAVPPA
jgi:CelD/BcsL family acetyltransferase involved in cellulose biosynthesis